MGPFSFFLLFIFINNFFLFCSWWVHMYTHMCTSAHSCMWKPGTDVKYLPQSLFTLFFEPRSLVEPGVHHPFQLVWLTNGWEGSAYLCPIRVGVPDTNCCICLVTWYWGSRFRSSYLGGSSSWAISPAPLVTFLSTLAIHVCGEKFEKWRYFYCIRKCDLNIYVLKFQY